MGNAGAGGVQGEPCRCPHPPLLKHRWGSHSSHFATGTELGQGTALQHRTSSPGPIWGPLSLTDTTVTPPPMPVSALEVQVTHHHRFHHSLPNTL